MTITMTVNDRLVELGTLIDNTDTAIQRAGAEMIEAFFNTHNEGENVDTDTVAQLLFYLTDIQVRDYTLGILNPDEPAVYMSALSMLLEQAPADTMYINAPASLLAVIHYELGNQQAATIALSNAEENYPLAQLLHRVFHAGWAPGSFATMRKEIHPLVTEGIFGEDN